MLFADKSNYVLLAYICICAAVSCRVWRLGDYLEFLESCISSELHLEAFGFPIFQFGECGHKHVCRLKTADASWCLNETPKGSPIPQRVPYLVKWSKLKSFLPVTSMS